MLPCKSEVTRNHYHGRPLDCKVGQLGHYCDLLDNSTTIFRSWRAIQEYFPEKVRGRSSPLKPKDCCIPKIN